MIHAGATARLQSCLARLVALSVHAGVHCWLAQLVPLTHAGVHCWLAKLVSHAGGPAHTCWCTLPLVQLTSHAGGAAHTCWVTQLVRTDDWPCWWRYSHTLVYTAGWQSWSAMLVALHVMLVCIAGCTAGTPCWWCCAYMLVYIAGVHCWFGQPVSHAGGAARTGWCTLLVWTTDQPCGGAARTR